MATEDTTGVGWRLGLRLGAADTALLKALAAKEHRTWSQMLRECLRREAERQGFPVPDHTGGPI